MRRNDVGFHWHRAVVDHVQRGHPLAFQRTVHWLMIEVADGASCCWKSRNGGDTSRLPAALRRATPPAAKPPRVRAIFSLASTSCRNYPLDTVVESASPAQSNVSGEPAAGAGAVRPIVRACDPQFPGSVRRARGSGLRVPAVAREAGGPRRPGEARRARRCAASPQLR